MHYYFMTNPTTPHFFPSSTLKHPKVRFFGAKAWGQIIKKNVMKQVSTLIKRLKTSNASSNLFGFCWFLSCLRHFGRHSVAWVKSRLVLNLS